MAAIAKNPSNIGTANKRFSRHLPIWRFQLKQAVQQLGWQAGTGLLLLLIALLVALFYVQPQRQQLAALQLQLAQLQRQKPDTTQSYLQNNQDIASQLYAILPVENEVNQKIAQLLAVADRTGLAVDKADYHRQVIANSSLVELHIQLPVSGSYVQMRQFIDQAFNALPSLALTDITFNRDDIGSDLVESDMQFNLYLRLGHDERKTDGPQTQERPTGSGLQTKPLKQTAP